jgi:uncharacterized membrane protein
MLLFISLLTGIACTLIGLVFSRFRPEKINPYSGFRTSISMKNQDTWDEAQRYGPKMFIIFGLISIGIALILYFLFPNNHDIISVISSAIGIVLLICSTIFTEIHMRKVFDKDGNRKNK